MTDLDATRNRLIAEIEAAFRDTQRGNGETLHEAALEGTGAIDETRRARLLDQDVTWLDIDDNVIDREYASLAFLNPEGFRYYIPAFMRFCLRHVNDSDSLSINWTIYSFCDLGNFPERFRSRCSVFNAEQARVICRFLRFMAEHSDGQADEGSAWQALNGYWGKFCNSDS